MWQYIYLAGEAERKRKFTLWAEDVPPTLSAARLHMRTRTANSSFLLLGHPQAAVAVDLNQSLELKSHCHISSTSNPFFQLATPASIEPPPLQLSLEPLLLPLSARAHSVRSITLTSHAMIHL